MRVKGSIAAIAVASVVAMPEPTMAQTSVAVDLGKFAAEKIASALLGEAAGKAFAAIFGGEKEQITIEQVENAINKAFEKAAVGDVLSLRNGLTSKLNDYSPRRSASVRNDAVTEILDRTGDLKGAIDAKINKDTSMAMIPAFVMAANTRIAFATERYAIAKSNPALHDDPDSERVFIADYAADALEELNTHMRTNFRDTARHTSPCIQKHPNQGLRINGAVGTHRSEKWVDISTWYCYGNGRVFKDAVIDQFKGKRPPFVADALVVNLGGAHYMRTTDFGYDRYSKLYLFAAKPFPIKNRYRLYQSSNEEVAHMMRNFRNLQNYPYEFGNLYDMAIGWLKIAHAVGDRTHLDAALKSAFKLGILPMHLKPYETPEFKRWMNQQISGFGEPWPAKQLFMNHKENL